MWHAIVQFWLHGCNHAIKSTVYCTQQYDGVNKEYCKQKDETLGFVIASVKNVPI